MKIKNILYKIKQPYIKIRNKILAKKYPWLLPYSVWSGELDKDFDYSYLWAEPDHGGWNKTIFYPMMNEIRDAAKRGGVLYRLHTSDYKSKYGGLRFYLNGGNDEIDEIISKYETLTEYICEICGKPDVGYTDGWIMPICKKCYKRIGNSEIPYEEAIKGTGRMPHYREYIKFDKDEKTHYKIDISQTANELRKRWNMRHPFRRTSYDT